MRTRTTLAALLAPLLLLTACGGGTPIADPPVASSPSSSSTPPPQRESPRHFIRRFVAVSNAMEMAGGTGAYLRLTLGCKTCDQLAAEIASARAHGGFYRSRGWTLQQIRVFVHGNSGEIDVNVRSAPTVFKMSAASPVQHYTGGQLTFLLSVRKTSGWHVTNVLQQAR